MQELGFNYRLSDLHAALGVSQLEKAEDGLERRRTIAKVYDQAFTDHPAITTQKVTTCHRRSHHAYHLYVIRVENRKEIYNHLRERGILVQVHYIPLHTLPYYNNRYGTQSFPNAERYYEECLTLPVYPRLERDEQQYVIDTLLDALRKT